MVNTSHSDKCVVGSCERPHRFTSGTRGKTHGGKAVSRENFSNSETRNGGKVRTTRLRLWLRKEKLSQEALDQDSASTWALEQSKPYALLVNFQVTTTYQNLGDTLYRNI